MKTTTHTTTGRLAAGAEAGSRGQAWRNRMLLSGFALMILALAGFSGVTHAANVDVYLQARPYTKELPDAIDVPMWIYASCVDNTFLTCTDGLPGPQINATAGDTLTIHLNNTLNVPVSVMIPGQVCSGASPDCNPVSFPDALNRSRMQSMTHETAPSTTNTYTWNSLRAGTYLYQSGTQPSLQVPMGLYGALVVGPSAVAADAEAVVLYSEIDPLQNLRVSEAELSVVGMIGNETCETLADWGGAGSTLNYPCTVDYSPTYFLVNGSPFDKTAPASLAAGAAGNDVLVRFLNAGLRSHAPAIVGLDMDLVAEDGNPYPGLLRREASPLLPAGKTLEALVHPVVAAAYPLFDRFLDLSNLYAPDGGMLAYLSVGGVLPPSLTGPTVVPESLAVTEDTATAFALPGGATLLIGPANGTYDGATYTPNGNFSGADFIVYRDSLGSIHEVTVNVSFVNDAPVAADDGAYVNNIGPDITVDAVHGVLGNDSDPDGDTLTAVLDTQPVIAGSAVTAGSVYCGATSAAGLCADGSFVYTGGTPGSVVTFTYHALETGNTPNLSSSTVTVTLNINPVANIALTVQDPTGTPLTDYRWLVQEDATFHNQEISPPPANEQLSLNFHKSSNPILAQGCIGPGCSHPGNEEIPVVDFSQVALDPAKYYYVSVLPNDAGTGAGHSLGGTQILPAAQRTSNTVTVVTNSQPNPPAQLRILVFEDNSPTNGVNDAVENGLGGFEITLEDAGGRYGMSGGTMSQDKDGNPLKNWLDCAPPATAGVILTCPNGEALIRNLPPGKYGVSVTPPAEQVGQWSQTSTLEGTRLNDTWVKSGEPPYWVEVGATGYHGVFGFVNPGHLVNSGGPNSITGHVTLLHDPRPPAPPGTLDTGSYAGLAHTRAWVGLNSGAGDGPNIETVQADEDGNFTLTNIPDGVYTLVVWDVYLDQVIAFQTVTLPADAGDIGHVPVNNWFTRQEHNVFFDANENGVYDPNEEGLPDQNVNIRFRDGTIDLTYPTDTTGFVPFDQAFPYFAWQVAEVDYTRFKPTGVTVTVDGGGDTSTGPYPGLLSVQEGSPRTDTGPFPVLLEAFQGFPGQTSLFDWGKAPYAPGENGGIAGIVFYSSTRGENDPRLTVGDFWEPGIAHVKVRLYREVARDPDLGGGTALALVQEVETDSWDDNIPDGCPGETLNKPGLSLTPDPFVTNTLGDGNITRCYDGWRNWNQVRPGVFDGGYAFTDIPPGKYVVEVVPPPGYQIVKEEDKNVDFGDTFGTVAPVALALPGGALLAVVPDQAMVLAAVAVEPGLAQPPCVGPDHLVPYELSLFPGVDTYAPFGGTMRPLCTRKEVMLSDQAQAAADFHLFSATPVAAQFYGLITDDIAVETNPASPGYGEQWSPAYLPFSIRDYTGHEVYRGHSDAFGHYNGLVASTFSANDPVPSGYSPGMYDACLNDPGNNVMDPLVDPSYGVFCYAAQYMPGTTTYLDTPILPGSAFAAGFNPPDCARPNASPGISNVMITGAGGNSPWTSRTSPGTILIQAMGDTLVPNPAYEGPLATPPYDQPTVTRNFGFGAQGPNSKAMLGNTELVINQWTPNLIQATLPAVSGTCTQGNNNGASCTQNSQCGPQSGLPANQGICTIPPYPETTAELVVTRNNGMSTLTGITVTVSNDTPIRVPADYPTIQAAIDAPTTNPGDLILVSPGVYNEQVVMWKPVRLQGAGAGGTIINATATPPQLAAQIQKINDLLGDGTTGLADLLPGQPTGGGVAGAANYLMTELGAGVTVLAKNDGSYMNHPSRIDGFTITGGNGGGGIYVNGWAHHLEISNNVVTRNQGNLHGGIRIGQPFLALTLPDDLQPDGRFHFNDGVNIHNNTITLNGSLGEQSAGGGLSLATGTDGYTVAHNFVCGNYTEGDGAGIGHFGLSDNGTIEYNQVLFNQSLNRNITEHGGGISVGGEPVAAPELTLGSGEVTINANRIQGNLAASGSGGGLRLQSVNGVDATTSPWRVDVTNNMIVDNVAVWAGGGISVSDAIDTHIINNTIANNDSTGTAGPLIATLPSNNQPAGIVAERHSVALGGVVASVFSNPELVNNIVFHNRSFHYDGAGGGTQLVPNLVPTSVGGCAAGANYWDLGVLGEPATGGLMLTPTDSILTSTTGYAASNLTGDPAFLSEYCNGARTLSAPGSMSIALAVAEGGNFTDVIYGPLTQAWPAGNPPWDYHIGSSSAGLDNANGSVAPGQDFDRENRPQGGGVDRGADEYAGVVVITGVCSANANNAGASCMTNTDCPPNIGNPANQGTCVFP